MVFSDSMGGRGGVRVGQGRGRCGAGGMVQEGKVGQSGEDRGVG